MLKRWAILMRTGVGLLGLCLVCGINADAASLRQGNHGGASQENTMMVGGTASQLEAASSMPAAAPPLVQEFSLAVSGTENFTAPESVCNAAGIFCNTGDACQCLVLTGTVTDGVGPFLGGAAATFFLNADILQVSPSVVDHGFNDGNNVGKQCHFATGILQINVTPTAQINFDTAGATCNSTGTGAAIYSGGFTIGTSTGGFSQAVGGGLIGLGADLNTKLGVLDLRGAGANLN